MKVIYFHQHFSTPEGAAGTRSYEMAQRLLRHGHEVTMVCGSYGVGKTGLEGPFSSGRRSGIVDGIAVIELEISYANQDALLRRSWLFLKFAFASLFIAMTARYDVIFATTTPLTAGIPGIFARWLRRKQFVFEVRDLWPELPKQMGVIGNPLVLGLLSGLEWLSYHSAQRCIALSPGIAEGIARRGVAKNRIALVPNGSDLSLFRAENTSLWRPAEVSPTDFMAIFAGTHGEANGLDAVLDAALVLQSRGRSDIKIALVGDGKRKHVLMNRSVRDELHNVVFLDPLSKLELIGVFASADLGIQCLRNVPAFYFGTSPNKFFDYIAAGLPVLNNYPGWLAEMIEEHECGFVVPPDDAIAFADALEVAADNRGALKQMGRNAYSLAEQNFDRNNLGDRWVAWVISGNSQ